MRKLRHRTVTHGQGWETQAQQPGAMLGSRTHPEWAPLGRVATCALPSRPGASLLPATRKANRAPPRDLLTNPEMVILVSPQTPLDHRAAPSHSSQQGAAGQVGNICTDPEGHLEPCSITQEQSSTAPGLQGQGSTGWQGWGGAGGGRPAAARTPQSPAQQPPPLPRP